MIQFSADIRSACATTDDAITTGSVGIPVQLNLSADFDGLAKTLVFSNGSTAVDLALVGDATEATVPPDVLTTPDALLQIGIYAADASGNIVIPTVFANVDTIRQGAAPSGVDPAEPTPSWVAQVQQTATEAMETANSVREDADAGKFDGEQGPPGPQGEQGPVGPQGPQGVPGEVSLAQFLAVYPTDTSAGPVASFSDGADGIPVKDLTVQIIPQQAGSGDPSPDNVRPISGWTGATISHSGADTSDPDTMTLSWESEAGTVYGGTLDVTTGLLTVNRGKKVFNGSENGWTANGAFGVAYDVNGFRPSASLTELPVADYLTSRPQGPGSGLAAWQCRYNPNGTHFLVRADAGTSASVTAWKAYLAEHPLTVLFGLAEPTTYQLTPQQVNTLLGVNNIWADTGDSSVSYRADVALYINKKLGVSG